MVERDELPGIDWQAVVVGHIEEERDHLQDSDLVPAQRVRLLFASLGGSLDGELGQVRYAGRCVIGRGDGIHLVLTGERGPVTALFIPGTPSDSVRGLRGEGMEGVLFPAGFGNLALVGQRGEAVEPMARRIIASIDW